MYKLNVSENYHFDVEHTTLRLVEWIKSWFAENGSDAKAVIGMSGGKDSTVAAALLCKALGADRVIGVSMPQGGQSVNGADKICEYLGMRMLTVNVGAAYDAVSAAIEGQLPLSKASQQNIPPRLRMTVLYAVGQSVNGRVANTCNLSEDYIGYATKYGDGAGDFSLFANLTVTEVLAIGDFIGLPHDWVHKTPDDGLPSSCPDEEKIGFRYAELDDYIRKGVIPEGHCHDNPAEPLKVDKIRRMNLANLHKITLMPNFEP